jgi:hypothetical protein
MVDHSEEVKMRVDNKTGKAGVHDPGQRKETLPGSSGTNSTHKCELRSSMGLSQG